MIDWVAWEYEPGRPSCDDCKESYEFKKEVAPCFNCEKPKHLNSKNKEALRLWELCSNLSRKHDGMSGQRMTLTVSEIESLCNAYGKSIDDFEKIILVEQIAYPLLCRQDAINAEMKKAQEKRNTICPV